MNATKTVGELLHELARIEHEVNELADTRDVFLSFGRNFDHVTIMAGVKTRPLDCRTVMNHLIAHGWLTDLIVSDYEIRMRHPRTQGD
jgi:hypothetical protein